MSDDDKIKEDILSVLRKSKRPLSQSAIARELKTSVPRISKYALVLEAEGKVVIQDYGNIKLISVKE